MSNNKILIGFGQSYNVGRESMATLDAKYVGLKQNLRVWNGTTFQCIDSTVNNNQFGQPSNQYGYEFELLNLSGFLNNNIYYLKYSIGGTAAFNIAGTNTSWNASKNDLLANLRNHMTLVENWMNNRNKDFDWFGLIWDQGQKDANDLTHANAYQVNENNILNNIDTHAGVIMKKYIVQLNDLDSRDYLETVKTAKINNVAADTTNRRLINVDGVTLGLDGVHPSKQGNELMGQRIVEAIKLDL